MGTASRLITEARRLTGLSQAELARRAGIPRSVLNAYERGKRQPGSDSLAAVLNAAGLDLRLAPLISYERNARVLSDVLDLAERLPYHPQRKLKYPGLPKRDT